MALVGTHQRSAQMSFHNGWLESLLSQIPKIWQHPPWPATTRSTSGASIAIMIRVHGDFTEMMATRSGKISKARSHLLVFAVIYCSYLMTTNDESTEEESNGGDDSQNNDFISLSRFELLEWLLRSDFSPLLLYFYYFMMSMWPWISLERGSCWKWSLRTTYSQCNNNPLGWQLGMEN